MYWDSQLQNFEASENVKSAIDQRECLSSCNLCGGTDLSESFRIDSRKHFNSDKNTRDFYTIVKCDDCGLVFVKEKVSKEELAEVYSEGYYTGRESGGYQDYDRQHQAASYKDRMMPLLKEFVSHSRHPRRMYSFLKALPELMLAKSKTRMSLLVDQVESVTGDTRGKLLDVGCATGVFLETARSSGWDVTGVEFSSYSSKVAREKRGINVEQGSLEDCIDQRRIPKSEFDVLTAWDVLEHLTDPMRTLKYFNKALKVGGFLFLETVNLDGRTAKQQGNNWHFYRPPKDVVLLFEYGWF
jgi:2-polyprenyl-3-methyl-5-hydroxy-6-metoxy-1,4-benzoquinol methylase